MDEDEVAQASKESSDSTHCSNRGIKQESSAEDGELQKQPKRSPGRQWQPWCMEAAVLAVVNGGSSLRDACSRFGVPFETLRRRVNKMRPGCSLRQQIGAPTVFTAEQEKSLAMRLQLLTKRGFPLTSTDIRRAAFKYAELIGVPHRFDSEHKIAGYEWLHGFMSRNPTLAVRKTEAKPQPRADRLTREWLDKFYDVLESTFNEHNLKDCPEHIFNIGESKFILTYEPESVVQSDMECDSSRGETVTVVSCCNAAGTFVPPVVIFKGLWHQRGITEGLPPGADVFVTSNGCMSEETLLLWLDHFARYKPDGTVVLLLDGHAQHTKSLSVIEFCLDHSVVCVCLPRHTTRALQPLDKSFFKSLNYWYKQAAKQWCMVHTKQKIRKEDFGRILADAWEKAATTENAVSGFSSLGIFPFDRRAILDHGLTTSAVKCEVESGGPVQVQRQQIPTISPSVLLSSIRGDITITPAVQVKKMCDFCGQMSGLATSSLKANWIRCDLCRAWYHEYCVGAYGKVHFRCGKCV